MVRHVMVYHWDCKLSFEWAWSPLFKSLEISNISETVQDRDSYNGIQIGNHNGLSTSMTANDLE